VEHRASAFGTPSRKYWRVSLALIAQPPAIINSLSKSDFRGVRHTHVPNGAAPRDVLSPQIQIYLVWEGRQYSITGTLIFRPESLQGLWKFQNLNHPKNHEYDGEINETWDNHFSGTA
jgi:hypothetical protein